MLLLAGPSMSYEQTNKKFVPAPMHTREASSEPGIARFWKSFSIGSPVPSKSDSRKWANRDFQGVTKAGRS